MSHFSLLHLANFKSQLVISWYLYV